MDRRKIILIVALVVAILGSGLVFLYVQGADSRANQRFAAVEVLVAKEPITAGETLAAAQAAGKIESRAVAAGSIAAGAVSSLEGMDMEGVAVTDLAAGEQILQTKFGSTSSASSLALEEGDVAVSVQLTDSARVAGFLKPGDRVVIFSTVKNGAADPSSAGGDAANAVFTRTLLQDAKVVGVGASTVVSTTTTTEETGEQTTEQVPTTLLTLSVSDAEAQRVVFSSLNHELSFALRNEQSEVDTRLGPTTPGNVFTGTKASRAAQGTRD